VGAGYLEREKEFFKKVARIDCKGWEYNSVVESMFTMCEALIQSLTQDR
jgi:hypothetical protein